MRKLLLVLLLLPSFYFAQAQKGFELKVSGGMEFLGVDPWINGGIVTGALIYNINGIVAVGASYSGGINNKYRIEAKANAYESSISELAADVYVTFLRAGRVKLYASAGVGQIRASNKELVPDFINFDPFGTPQLDISDSSIGFGLGAGGVLNLSGGFYLNFFEYRLRTVNSEFMQMDKGFNGSVGPMHTFKAGISYIFGAK